VGYSVFATFISKPISNTDIIESSIVQTSLTVENEVNLGYQHYLHDVFYLLLKLVSIKENFVRST
jgi:hypothetical protein